MTSVETMSEVLKWSGSDEILAALHASYIARLSDSLGQLLGKIHEEDTHLADSVIAEMRKATDEGLLRVVTAPETSARLMAGRNQHLRETGMFLVHSFHAEAARLGNPVRFHEEVWTALGDMGFFPDGTIRRMPEINGIPPLDFGSPWAVKIDLSGADRGEIAPRPSFNGMEIDLVLKRLREAYNGIRDTSPLVAAFVSLFNKVLILQKDPDSPAQFASGSSGRYIGRCYLANPHEVFVDHIDIADAMIHEGIHALLYIQQRNKWLFESALHHSARVVTSPWTGNGLSLLSFLQACFVWYGLLNFWRLALAAGTFDPKRVGYCISRSLRGFLAKPLIDHLSDYKSAIKKDLLETLYEIQLAAIKADARACY